MILKKNGTNKSHEFLPSIKWLQDQYKDTCKNVTDLVKDSAKAFLDERSLGATQEQVIVLEQN